ncbi:hypothetical protein DWUX_226 [Desulfovibrio diazotrophicus]|nr:hypothetical protein DWUX_226 [Desulfovibrio diazotrophicus]
MRSRKRCLLDNTKNKKVAIEKTGIRRTLRLWGVRFIKK